MCVPCAVLSNSCQFVCLTKESNRFFISKTESNVLLKIKTKTKKHLLAVGHAAATLLTTCIWPGILSTCAYVRFGSCYGCFSFRFCLMALMHIPFNIYLKLTHKVMANKLRLKSAQPMDWASIWPVLPVFVLYTYFQSTIGLKTFFGPVLIETHMTPSSLFYCHFWTIFDWTRCFFFELITLSNPI